MKVFWLAEATAVLWADLLAAMKVVNSVELWVCDWVDLMAEKMVVKTAELTVDLSAEWSVGLKVGSKVFEMVEPLAF